MYLYGFVEPQSGKTSWLLMPTVNTEAFSLALAAFAQEQGVGPNKHLLLVLDQAGWHKSADLKLLERYILQERFRKFNMQAYRSR